jgi:predicted kinase
VDGHGDVHLQHVWFEAGRSEPTLIDCIEFNDELRRIDAAAEVAFLAMDLIYRRRSRLADRFLRVYAGCADDFELYRVVDYFLSYRAAVRAKVAASPQTIRGIDATSGVAADSARAASSSLLFRAPPARRRGRDGGRRGNGEEHGGRSSSCAPASVIASDLVRKRLHGMSATDRCGAAKGLYSRTARDRVYTAILERAAAVVDAGRVAVLDATYARTQQRDAVLRFAAQRGVPVWIVETRARRATALARLALRQSRGDSASDAGPARYAASVAEFRRFGSRGVRRQIVRTDTAGKLALRRARGRRRRDPGIPDAPLDDPETRVQQRDRVLIAVVTGRRGSSTRSSLCILIGFFIAGLLTGSSRAAIARHLGKSSPRSVSYWRLFGAPIPLCSCGVLPAAAGGRRARAARQSRRS